MDGDSYLTTVSTASDIITSPSEEDKNLCQSKIPELSIQCTLPQTSHPPLHHGVDILGKSGNVGEVLAWPVLCHEVDKDHVYGEFCIVCQIPSPATLEGVEELRIMVEEAKNADSVPPSEIESEDSPSVLVVEEDGSEETRSHGEPEPALDE